MRTNPYHTDELLWKAFKSGNEAAFSTLFHLYYEDVYFYGVRFVGDTELVKDTLQELFSEIWIRRQKLGDVQHIKAYLIKSLRRKLLKIGKAKKRAVQVSNELQYLKYGFEISIEDFIVEKERTTEQHKRLAQILPKLNRTQREIIYLRFYNNMDYKEIAEVTNLKYQSVRNSMHKALKILRESFIWWLIYWF